MGGEVAMQFIIYLSVDRLLYRTRDKDGTGDAHDQPLDEATLRAEITKMPGDAAYQLVYGHETRTAFAIVRLLPVGWWIPIDNEHIIETGPLWDLVDGFFTYARMLTYENL
jgi:hypothetical protein